MGKTILVVDDASFMREMISKILAQNGYDRIVKAEDGEIAVEMFKTNRPDLVIMDVTMPNMDGLDACKAMKEIDSNVPVILSGVSEFTNKAFKAGAIDYLAKPFTPNKLTEMVSGAFDDSPCIVPTAKSSAKMVLIVDRSASIRAVIKKYVNDVCHCDIAEAKDGRTAIELFKSFEPDVVFMEIQLPGMSGLEACRDMGDIDANVPVVVLTKKEYMKESVKDSVNDVIKAGAKDFIIKPFEEDRFKKTVKAILG